jgi:hypothetical protein
MPIINARDPSGIGKRKGLRRRSFRTCDRLGAAIPLPKRVSPPATEVGLSGPTKLLISRENELGLRGGPRGGPSEGRAGNQRDQCETSDKCLHHISPCLSTTVPDFPATEKTDALCLVFPKEIGSALFPKELGSAPRSDQLYLWIYWISQRSKALYFGFVSSRHSLGFDLGSAWPVCHAVQNRCGAAATRIEIFCQGWSVSCNCLFPSHDGPR